MENKTNISAIELYSRKALKPFLEKFFQAESLNGKQVLNFCPIEQVNFFILYLLFDKWQEETKKLESPYFDFQHEEVKKAIKTFMNVLSQQISVKKDPFSPLLLQSIFNTIFFAVSPLPFLEQKLIASDRKYTSEDLQNLWRYIKIHPKLVEFSKNNISDWEGKSGKEIMLIFKNEWGFGYSDENVANAVLTQFNEILPVHLSDFHYHEPQATFVAETPKPSSITEILGKGPKSTTVNLHTKNKILDIRAAMNINQRFMFIKELFKGNEPVFQQAMDFANNAENYEKAVNTLIDNYAQKYNWQIDSDQVSELFDLVGRKFYPDAFRE